MSKVIESRQTKERELLIEQLKKTPIVQFACEKSGISRATYYRWKTEDKAFCEEADQALQEGVSLMNDLAESQLLTAIKERNLTAVFYWLNHRHKSYTNKLEISGKPKTFSDEMTKEEVKALTEALGLFGGEYENNEKDIRSNKKQQKTES